MLDIFLTSTKMEERLWKNYQSRILHSDLKACTNLITSNSQNSFYWFAMIDGFS